jgi:nickel-dependent lactate racemase
MKLGGIDYGLKPAWEIEVPDDAIVVENIESERIEPALEDPAGAVRDAIRAPLGAVRPLADQVGSSSKVTIAINDWMGISVHAVPVVLDELREAGVDERNVRIITAGGLHPKMTRRDLYLTKVGRDINPPYPSPFHILSPEVIDRFWPTGYGSSRVRPHDASDPDHLVELGVTEYGDLVEMNDCVTESDLVIYMSGWSGLPSIWGGYLGGGQGVTVGLGSDRSIMTHHSYRIHEHPESMPSEARKQRFMKHKEAVAAFVEQATGKKVFYVEGSLNTRAEFVQVVAGEGSAIREPIFTLADKEKIVDIPEQVDVFVSGGAHWGTFYDTVNNPFMSLVQINSRIREYVGDKPPLRQGGVAILVTPCDGSIDERFRPSDREMIQLFNSLNHDPARLEDYEEEYAHREDLIAKYRWAYGAHPLHPFPVFYENSFIFDLCSRIIFAGAADPVGAQMVGATAVPTWEDAWALACKTLGKRDPSVMVTPNVGARMPLLWRVAGGGQGGTANGGNGDGEATTGGSL